MQCVGFDALLAGRHETTSTLRSTTGGIRNHADRVQEAARRDPAHIPMARNRHFALVGNPICRFGMTRMYWPWTPQAM